MKYIINLRLFFFTALTFLFIHCSDLFAQDFWYSLSGPYGGNILCLTENLSGKLFVGTEGGGVFRSLDDGDTWELANEGLPTGDGPTVFKVYSILIHTNGDIFLGTSKEGRIYRSTDDGNNWTQVYSSPLAGLITNCFTSTANGSILAGTDVSVLKSTDNGDTWNPTLTSQTVRQLLKAENGEMVAGTSTGIFKSIDNGDTWNSSNSGLTNTNIKVLNKNSLGVIFCVTINNKVFKSTDNANTWVEAGNIASTAYCVTSNSSNELYAGTSSGLYKSIDNGSTWVEDSLDNKLVRVLHFNNLDKMFVGTDWFGMYRYQQGGTHYETINNGLTNTFINAMTFNIDGDLFCATNSNKFYKTSSLGTTWIDISDEVSVAMSPSKIVSLITLPNGVMIAGTVSQGIFRSVDDGNNWTQVLNGFTTFNIYCLAIDKTGNLLAGSYNGKLYKSTNQGLSWTSIDNNQINSNIYDIAVNSNGHIFLATTPGGVYRSTDEGNNWTQVNDGILYTNAYAIAINDSDDLFVTGDMMGGIYRNTTNGNSPWAQVLSGTFSSYDLIINDLGDVFVSSIDSQGALRSTNNGNTWEQINTGLYNYNMRCLIFSGGPFSYLFGGGEGTGVWLSQLPTGPNLAGEQTNLGLPILYGIPVMRSIVIFNNPPNKQTYVDNPIEKVFVTLQEINHPDISELLVTLEHEGIIDTLVYQPGINGADFFGTKFKDGALLDLSQGAAPFTSSFKPRSPLSVFNELEATGNWTLTINDLVPGNDGVLEAWSISILSNPPTGINEKSYVPNKFILDQNYPNPFNPTTTIRYSIPQSEFVTLQVFDVLGNEVTTLVNEEKPAGNYEVNFNVAILSSGIYLYRLQAGSFVETKKMILLR